MIPNVLAMFTYLPDRASWHSLGNLEATWLAWRIATCNSCRLWTNVENIFLLTSLQKIKDYDDMFKYKVGQFGAAQALVIFLICIPSAMPGPLAFFAQIFLAATPEHWCYTPSLVNSSLTTEQIKSLTLPPADLAKPEELSQCRVYDVDFVNYLIASNGSTSSNKTWPTTSCKHGWTYDKSVFESTIVTEVIEFNHSYIILTM